MFSNLGYEGEQSTVLPLPSIMFLINHADVSRQGKLAWKASRPTHPNDQEAFFSLLDEYFASRPHLLSSSSNRTSLSPTSSFHAPSPTSTTSTSGRTLPPVNRSPAPPLSSPNSYSGSNNNSHSGEKPDMATRLVSSGLKLGTAGARTGLNMLSKNQKAMDAIGRAGANAMVAQAQSRLGGSPQQEQQEVDQGHGYGGGGGAPPAPAKKSGMGGFANKVSGVICAVRSR